VLDAESVSAMLAQLKDPYTEYLTAPAYRLLRQETSARYSGIGATLMPSPDGLLVVATQPGPARNSGIAVGDTITRVDATPTKGLGVAGALTHILGPRGTVVELRVLRGGRTLDFDVRPEEISAPTVRGPHVDEGRPLDEAAARSAHRPLHRELGGDRRRCAARRPSRTARRDADVREGRRPDNRPAWRRRRARPHDRPLLHACRRR